MKQLIHFTAAIVAAAALAIQPQQVQYKSNAGANYPPISRMNAGVKKDKRRAAKRKPKQ